MKVLKLITLGLVFLVCGVFFIHTFGSINQDIGRHLKTGEIIWQTKQVPKVNLFSYTEPNAPFINHHWLSEVVFFLVNGLIGLKGLIIFKSLTLVLALWLLYQGISKQINVTPFAIACLSGLMILQDRTDVRPEIFSFLFLAFFLFAIFRAKYNQEIKWLYFLPIVQLLWTNMHIYFLLGPALIGLFSLNEFINKKPIWKRSAQITGLAILAMLVNPNFIAGALTPLTILNNYGYEIVENQSVIFIKNYGILLTQINIFILGAVLFWLSYIPAIKKHGFKNYIFEIGAGLTFTYLGFSMIRNFGPFVIVFIPIFALNIQAWLEPKIKKPRQEIILHIITLLITGLTLISILNSNLYGWLGSGDKFGLNVPTGAENGIAFVKNNNLKGPVFNNFDVGSYLIWKLYPEQRVFVDGRPESYPADFFSDIYEPMQENPAIWQHYADEVYKINYIFFDYHDITPWAQSFLNSISQDHDWAMVYWDNSVVVFARRNNQNSNLINKFEIKKSK